MFPLCETEDEEDDTKDDVLKCGRGRDRKQRNIKNNTEEKWEKVVQIFRENTRKIENLERKFRKKSSLDSVVLYSRSQWTFWR